jgi:WD40 repeat protein
LNSATQTAIFDKHSDAVIATTWQSELTVYSPTTGIHVTEPHDEYNSILEQSHNGALFAAYGENSLIEIWASPSMIRTKLLNAGGSSVSKLHFVGDTDEFVTSDHDGRLIRWDSFGRRTTSTQVNQPIDNFVLVPAANSIVFNTQDGALWRTDPDRPPLILRNSNSRITRIILTSDQRTIIAGYANGAVISFDMKSSRQVAMFQAAGAVREIAITDDGHTLAIATDDGAIHICSQDVGGPPWSASWVKLVTFARHIVFTHDGLLIAVCTDGTIWLYSTLHRTWLCLPIGTISLTRTVVAPNEETAIVLDSGGRLTSIDLHTVRNLLDTRN